MWIDDDILAQAHQALVISTWVPRQPMVVLGRSNSLAEEVNADWCRSNGVSLWQRYGGGGTVVLYQGCLVVSLGCWVTRKFHNEAYFFKLNQALIQATAGFNPAINLDQDGISDITLGDKKVGGTSLFRSGNYLLYQASLICQLDLALIEACLRHPSREPEYRRGRSHGEFLTDLTAWEVEPGQLKRHFDYHLMTHLVEQLGDEQEMPIDKQMKNLNARWQRGQDGEGQLC